MPRVLALHAVSMKSGASVFAMCSLSVECVASHATGRTYTLVKTLGHGAFGEVLLAEDSSTQQQYAAKQLYLRQDADGLPLPVSREMSALQLLHHPNVIALVDTAANDHCLYLVQELCRTDLAAVLAAVNRHLPSAVVKSIMQQLLQALAACHDLGLLHRDVKPSNLLMTNDGMLKLGDFGLARSFDLQRSEEVSAMPVSQATPAPATGAHNSGGRRTLPHQLKELACSQQRDKQSLSLCWQQCSGQSTEDKPLPANPCAPSQPQHDRQTQHASHQGKKCLTAAQGTRWYRAPELLYGSRCYSSAVDIWAAGMVFAEILGLSPFIPGQSDIDQLARMQQTLGSIDLQEWPEAEQLPDWHKVMFGQSPGIGLDVLLPDASAAALDLLQGMLRYNPSHRLTATAALQHRYFTTEPPAVATAVEVSLAVDEVLQQSTPAMPHRGVSFCWSVRNGSTPASEDSVGRVNLSG